MTTDNDKKTDPKTRPSTAAALALVIIAAIALGAVFIDWSSGWAAGLVTLVTGSETTDASAGGQDEVDARPAYRFPVTVAPVRAERVVEAVSLVGDVVSLRWSRVAFQRSGRVSEALARLGDEVSEGQLLARLDDRVIENQIEVQKAAAKAAEALAQNARREAARGNEVGDDLLSASNRDRRNADAEVANFRALQAAAEVKRLATVLEQGQLTAPFDGVVTRADITDGSHAAAGVTAFTVMDLEHRRVLLEVPTTVAAGLTLGAEVQLTIDAAPEVQITAHLDKLIPAADFGTRNFRAIVELGDLDPERRLLPGMFVRARFVRRAVDGDYVVPVDAVQGVGEDTWIIVARDGSETADGEPGDDPPVAVRVPITVLARNTRFAAVMPVEEGALEPDASVIVTGADNVFPGAALRPIPHRLTGAVSDAAPAGESASEPASKPASEPASEPGTGAP